VVVRRPSVPLYQQVRTTVLERIETGVLRPGDRLPAEQALAHELGTHRLTVRRALEELAREGVLHARQGVGTFVTARPTPLSVTLPLTREQFASSLRDELEAGGRAYREVLLSTTTAAADDADVRADLQVATAAIRRVDTALEVDGERWVVSTAWLPDLAVSDVAGRWRESTGLYGLLLDERADELRYLWRSFSAVPASPADAQVLGVRTGAPLLLREGLTADGAGRPLVRVRRRARPDRVRYVLEYAAK
jgi:DNA-binding GntR family transcriptional regulator